MKPSTIPLLFRASAFVLLATVPIALCAGPVTTIHEATDPFVWPANAPRPDDVTMRTLWFRPLPVGCEQDTFEALKAFHATRLDWSYLRTYEPQGRFEVEMGWPPIRDYDLLLVQEKELIRRVKRMGRVFTGASNASNGTRVIWHGPRDATKEHTIIDIEGRPLIGGHMREWTAPQSPGCANNPHYLDGHVQYIINYIDAGAQGMQRDEPSGNESYAGNGLGCFCEYCMEGFRKHLQVNHGDELATLGIDRLDDWSYREHVRRLGLAGDPDADFDWSDPRTMRGIVGQDPLAGIFREFQARAQERFFKIVRARVNAYHGDSFPYSCNNTSFQRFDPELYHGFDFYMSELMMRSANPVHLYQRSNEARRRGKIQVFGSPKTMGEEYDEGFLVDLRRRVIATSYAVGGLCQAPWDLFEQTADGLGRYFGDPAHYADLFAMVRASGHLLHGYDDAGAWGPGIPDEIRYGQLAPLRVGGNAGDYYAFLRARAGDADAPVVVHLVDWNPESRAVELYLRPDAFFPGRGLRVTLRTPAAYDAGMHAGAEYKAQAMRASDDQPLGIAHRDAYANLVERAELPVVREGPLVRVQLPVLRPWGMLVVEPAPVR
jgi:hypothetical protein